MRRLLAFLAVVVVLASGCGGGGSSGSINGSTNIISGTPSRLKSTLRSLRGKPVVVNYWATWCGPCKEEMPRIVAAQKTYGDRVHFLGVDVQDDAKSAADFIRRYGMRFRSLSDPDGDIRNAERILGLPVTQFYSGDGELAFLKQGEISARELNEKIEGVLELERKADPSG